ncbi:hypothetical protein BD309DRAFT_875981 [Dichomitus squalens]|uniref:Uncharacterized protein n=1 Tax=Dichomitus squalens TaxID=114155 RepID=A0A4Q9NEN4_9APHY|nr:hypothetical protein BD309DRAFT_875981 [Dichomitus squalens]TBU61804.1 hypothetical protein BD310DRAFT_812468 [Dichomitus squalens]
MASITAAGVETVFKNVDLCGAAVSTMLMFEYLITLDDEAKYIWKKRATGPSILYYMNRYYNLAFCMYQWIVLNPAYRRSAESPIQHKRLLQQGYQLISDRPASNSDSAVSLFRLLAVSATISSQSLFPEIVIVSRLAVIVTDALLLVITWTQLARQGGLRRWGDSKGISLTDVLLRDGTIYFLHITRIMLILNCLHMAFTLVSVLNIKSLQNLSAISIFETPITAILVSRFLINLQASERGALPLNEPGTGTQTSQNGELDSGASIVFNRVVGSLQRSLAPQDFTEDNTHEDDDAQEVSNGNDGAGSLKV